MAKHNKAEHSGKNTWLETIGVIIGALVLALVVQAFVVKPYKIPSPSMEPTLAVGQRVLVNRLANNFSDPKVGEIIVFEPPSGAENNAPGGEQCAAPRRPNTACLKPTPGKLGKAYVKRLVGLPGDRLSVKAGRLTRNGKAVDEPYAQPCEGGDVCDIPTFTVPKGGYFMMGDNRGNSDDSRYWGPVPRENIVGRAFATYWPIDRIGGL